MENKKPKSLKRNSDFLNLKDRGKKIWAAEWLLINYLKTNTEEFRFGVTVSKRVGNAVTRNKLKRWTRESVSSWAKQGRCHGVDINVIFRPREEGFYKELKFSDFEKCFDRSIQKITNIISK